MREYRRNPIAFITKERRELWRNVYDLCAMYDDPNVQRILRMPRRHFNGLQQAKLRAMGVSTTRELDAADRDAIDIAKKMIAKKQESES